MTFGARVRTWLGGGAPQASLPPIPQPTYPGAGRGYRVAAFGSARLGVNAALSGSLEVLRARSQHLFRTDAHFNRAIRAHVAMLVGTGITPQLDPLIDRDTRRRLIRLFTRWTDFADADGRTDFYGLQVTAAIAKDLTGEVFIRRRSRLPEDKLPVPFQLQVLEADHCPIDKNENLPNGNIVRYGKEFNGIGKCVAYYFWREHPNDSIGIARAGGNELVRVSADQVLHIYESFRPGQLRGEPLGSRVLLTSFFLSQFRDFTLEKAKCAAGVTGFINVQPDAPGFDPETGRPLNADPNTPIDTAGAMDMRVDPGALINGNPGESVTWAPSADVGDFDSINKAFLREIAVGAGSSYTHMSGDYEPVNFSSLREEGLQLARENSQQIFTTFNPQMNAPIWTWFMEAAVSDARARKFVGLTPSQYAEDPLLYVARWYPPRKEYANPQQEAEADRLLIRLGAKSLSSLIRERFGEDPETVFEEIAEERKFMAALGISVEADPASVIDMVSRPSVGAPAEAPKPARKAA